MCQKLKPERSARSRLISPPDCARVYGDFAKSAINKPVFFISSSLIALLLVITAIFPDNIQSLFNDLIDDISKYLGWFYTLTVAVNLALVFFFCVSRYGAVRLGKDDSRPEFSFASWLAMLFSAGMGTGLMFFGVAEPLMHFSHPPSGNPDSIHSAREAIQLTFLHWGFHAWAIYSVIGLSIAYFSYRYEQPFTFRSCLYPVIGDRVFGKAGHIIDIFAIIGTIFGVATALGVGVLQVSSGLNYLLHWQLSHGINLLLILAVTGLSTLSAVSGLNRGIIILSRLNLALAMALLLLVIALGPTVKLLDLLVQNIGSYLSGIVEYSFNMYAYQDRDIWNSEQTLFYWSYWLSWSPFVGMFIARISRGRTIREMICGSVVVPSLLIFIWFTAFGNTSISAVMDNAAGNLANIANQNVSLALFVFLKMFPGFAYLSALSILIIVIFFVTSADSCAIVVSTLSSKGVEDPSLWQRAFWSAVAGAAAALLLMAGGLKALEAVTIGSALPLSLIMLLTGYGLLRILITREQG